MSNETVSSAIIVRKALSDLVNVLKFVHETEKPLECINITLRLAYDYAKMALKTEGKNCYRFADGIEAENAYRKEVLSPAVENGGTATSLLDWLFEKDGNTDETVQQDSQENG